MSFYYVGIAPVWFNTDLVFLLQALANINIGSLISNVGAGGGAPAAGAAPAAASAGAAAPAEEKKKEEEKKEESEESDDDMGFGLFD
ncbi:acidic ribosomal 1 [Pelobates cultripes]|uniref:Acidic ribosomal 1 n=1 Tax=Pelobates cultripes TaxID=61616 RepID=A0AAD1S431_PELCU|nr:acidic ribosomal 1 [Pelobates cultripes]